MSSSSFELILDTTPPDISITAPSYTIPQVDTDIVVQASEALSGQEIYFIDTSGARYDYLFTLNGDAYDGVVQFNDVACGIGTLYAKVWDDVRNASALVSRSINILPSAQFTTDGVDSSRLVATAEDQRVVAAAETERRVDAGGMIRELTGQSSDRVIDSTDGARKVEVAVDAVSAG